MNERKKAGGYQQGINAGVQQRKQERTSDESGSGRAKAGRDASRVVPVGRHPCSHLPSAVARHQGRQAPGTRHAARGLRDPRDPTTRFTCAKPLFSARLARDRFGAKLDLPLTTNDFFLRVILLYSFTRLSCIILDNCYAVAIPPTLPHVLASSITSQPPWTV
jgi:hypothetical protein